MVDIIYRDNTKKSFGDDGYNQAERRLTRACYADDENEVKYILSSNPTVDVDAIVINSNIRGNGTPLILNGLVSIAKLLIEKGADVNRVYRNITALDSAIEELGKQRTLANESIQQEIENLIEFLKANGAKTFNELTEDSK